VGEHTQTQSHLLRSERLVHFEHVSFARALANDGALQTHMALNTQERCAVTVLL
jgi:hypothetical protein